MHRRRFLAGVALTPAALACRPQKPAPPPPSPPPADGCQVARRDGAAPRVLTPTAWATLDAACERLLPADADPGARAAGVINFIDAQLRFPPIASLRGLITTGAAELDRLAGGPFARLDAAAQDRVLTELQSATGAVNGPRFFEVLLSLTLEGFFADPIYGGNRDGVGWRLIDFQPRAPSASCAWPGL